MTEEVVKGTQTPDSTSDATDQTQTSAASSKEPQYTARELEAMDQGWQPLEAWTAAGHDAADHRSAREFLDRGELLSTIRATRDELRKTQEITKTLADHNQKVYVAGYNKAITDLRQAKAAALEKGDARAVVAIEERIDQMKDARDSAIQQSVQQVPASPQPAQETPAFKTFKSTNRWYEANPDMRHFAHGVAIDYAAKNPNASEEQVYEYMARQTRRAFAGQFSGQTPPSPDGAGRSASGPSRTGGDKFEALMATLPEDQVRVARNMVKAKVITKEKYVADYEAIANQR